MKNLLYSILAGIIGFILSVMFIYNKHEKQIAIGEAINTGPFIHITFTILEEFNVEGDTLFVIIKNDSLLKCESVDGKHYYMRYININDFEILTDSIKFK